ncbi:MAG: hypothetical protein OEZ68_09705 [Gammaproteobacteria bacterium]|nr:hypothetical protein [Gammaproteobacteria bacterium]MDH5801062.1 hypothetical protein [Gammaproteobacteria bacterium]
MINIVVALPCEAQPLVEHLGLHNVSLSGPFRLYTSEAVSVLVSGVGRLHAAAATAYLQAYCGADTQHAWINMGIAGHREYEVGRGFLAHKVSDSDGASFFPGLSFDFSGQTAAVLSVDRAECDFEQDVLYEMEAAGFYAIASRFSSTELVHCYKVVSDNSATGTETLDKQTVKALVQGHLGIVDELIRHLSEMLAHVGEPVQVQQDYTRIVTAGIHFTVTQKAQLRGLLRRCHALGLDDCCRAEALIETRSAKQIFSALRDNLHRYGCAY